MSAEQLSGVGTSGPAIESSSIPAKPKKVRSACERCRSRRIKCDGQMPACGNCSKAGVLCVDVDGREGETRVLRGLGAADASARIAWLEDIIRNQLPHVNLDAGPAFSPAVSRDMASVRQYHPPRPTMGARNMSASSDPVPHGVSNSELTRGQKRPASVLNDNASPAPSVEQDTRSVALELGLLALNADSRQVHYLGSSSGSLFASLLQSRKYQSGDSNKNGTYTSLSRLSEIEGLARPDDRELQAPQYAETRKAIEALYAQLRKELPSRDDCNVLLNRFFQHMHPNHPFLHQPSFIKMVDCLYKCTESAQDCQIQYNGWPAEVRPVAYNGDEHSFRDRPLMPISVHIAAFQLFIALSIGATLQIRTRKYAHNPAVFFTSAISLAPHVFGSISLAVLQSVLLVAVHSLMDPEGFNIWTLSHIATAHAIDLGLHREVGQSNKFSATSIQMRRRIFYCVYTLDRTVSTIQGRPLGLADDTFDVQLPKVDISSSNISSPNMVGTDGGDTCTLPYSIQVFKMSRLISQIKWGFYRFIDATTESNSATIDQTQLRGSLNHWLTESSNINLTSIAPEQRNRLLTKLSIQYHAAMCLLHQPSQKILQPNDQALQYCFDSAIQRIRLYEQLYDSGALYHSWRTVQDIFLAGVSVMYCVFISKNVRRSSPLASLSRDFRSCSTMLSIGGEWWPIIRKARVSFERLLNHTLEMLSADSQARSRTFATIPSPGNFASDGIGDILTSLVNHDGNFPNIFDSFPATGFVDGFSNMTGSMSDAVWPDADMSDDFWSTLGSMDFLNPQNPLGEYRDETREPS